MKDLSFWVSKFEHDGAPAVAEARAYARHAVTRVERAYARLDKARAESKDLSGSTMLEHYVLELEPAEEDVRAAKASLETVSQAIAAYDYGPDGVER